MARNFVQLIFSKKYLYLPVPILTLLLLVTAGVTIYNFFGYNSSNSQAKSEGILLIGVNDCGPVALDNACKIYGIASTLAEIADLARTNTQGTTFQGLHEAALKKGFRVARFDGINISRLKTIKLPAIAFVNGDHFFLLNQLVGDQLHVLDAHKVPYWLSTYEFSKIWHGGHLLSLDFDKPSTAKVKEPRIQFVKYLYDFGEQPQKSQISYDYLYQNVGNAPLTIKNVETSCQCVTSFAEEQTLLPGEKGKLKISYTPSGSGFQTQLIEVFSNDPTHPVTVLTVRGFLKAAPQAKPSRLVITSFQSTPGILKREIVVIGSSDLRIKEVATNARGVTVQHINPNSETEDWNPRVTVSIDVSSPRTLGEKLIIYTNDLEHPKITVPIIFQLSEPLTISPNRLLFGVVSPGQIVARSVLLTDNTDGGIQILDVKPQSALLSAELINSKTDNQYQLVVKFKAAITPSTLNSSVVITTNQRHSEDISIPVFAIIAAREK